MIKKINLGRVKGDPGEPFTIDKIYESVEEMNSSFATDSVSIGHFVVINTGNTDDKDNGKLYRKDEEGYTFIVDMSGSGGGGSSSGGESGVAGMPKGAIYPQYPGKSDPATIFGGTWKNVSSEFAGKFFRAEGGAAAPFGESQSEGLPNIEGSLYTVGFHENELIGFYENNSGCIRLGAMNSKFGKVSEVSNYTGSTYFSIDASLSNSLYGASSHVTPENATIRIWEKVS